MYTTVRASFKYNGQVHNDIINSYQGVKQGDPSSPLLFIMFVNDLMSYIIANLDKIFTKDELCIAEHASKALHRLFAILYRYEFKTSEKCKLFDSLVSSLLNYCSEILGNIEVPVIEKINCRKIIVVNTSTNLTGLYGELGQESMKFVRQIHMIRNW